jgi:hypothetical protein
VAVVDRLVQGAGVDLASPVTIGRRHDVRKQFGQLRLVVGAHAFAGGLSFALGAHDLGRYPCPSRSGAGARGPSTSSRPLGARSLLPLGWPGLKRGAGRLMAARYRISHGPGRRTRGELPPRLIDVRNAACECVAGAPVSFSGPMGSLAWPNGRSRPAYLQSSAPEMKGNTFDCGVADGDGHGPRSIGVPLEAWNLETQLIVWGHGLYANHLKARIGGPP